MHTPKKKPEPARVSGSRANSTPSNFTSLASIRRRFGNGIAAYEYAKAAWLEANPSACRADRDNAMRRIARAVGI
jgi:hypothetical protein